MRIIVPGGLVEMLSRYLFALQDRGVHKTRKQAIIDLATLGVSHELALMDDLTDVTHDGE